METIVLLYINEITYRAKLVAVMKQYTNFNLDFINELLKELMLNERVTISLEISVDEGNAFLYELSELGMGIGHYSWHEENRFN
jgi:hypothetical protein